MPLFAPPKFLLYDLHGHRRAFLILLLAFRLGKELLSFFLLLNFILTLLYLVFPNLWLYGSYGRM